MSASAKWALELMDALLVVYRADPMSLSERGRETARIIEDAMK